MAAAALLRQWGIVLALTSVSRLVGAECHGECQPEDSSLLQFATAHAINRSSSSSSSSDSSVKKWILSLPKTWSDRQLKAFALDVHKSTRGVSYLGHPGKGGLSMIVVNADKETLDKVLADKKEILGISADDTFEAGPDEVKEDVGQDNARGGGYEQSNWGLDRIDQRDRPLDGNYIIPESAGANVHVYIFSTGIRMTHQELVGRSCPMVDTSIEPPAECNPSDTGCALDTHGLGTHTAAIVAGATFGVAKSAKLYGVKVMKNANLASWTSTLVALDYVGVHVQKPAVYLTTLWKKETPSIVQEAVDAVVSGGTTFVVGAGNDKKDSCSYTFAFVAHAITVAGSNPNDKKGSSTNTGGCVNIFAPGALIRSAGVDSDTDTMVRTGTGAAAGHVAGAIAILLGANPALLPEEVTFELFSKATLGKIRNPGEFSPNRLLYVEIPPTTTTTTTVAPLDDTNQFGECCFSGADCADATRVCHDPSLVCSQSEASCSECQGTMFCTLGPQPVVGECCIMGSDCADESKLCIPDSHVCSSSADECTKCGGSAAFLCSA